MSTVVMEHSVNIATEGPLYKAICEAVNNCLIMCNSRARCVGVSTVPAHEPGNITGMIGVHGKVSGFVNVNLAERVAIKAVGGLLQENYQSVTAQVVDGVGEITNIIVGGIKSALANTSWAFPHITVPSVIVGNGYRMTYAKGLDFLCVVFEHVDPEAVMFEDRMMQVSVSLLKL
ncbi:MAG: chemotaxis protein CheX [Pirellulales bacterium]